MSDHLEADLDAVVAMLKRDEKPTPQELDALARVGKALALSVASISLSLRRIADAAERGVPPTQLHRG